MPFKKGNKVSLGRPKGGVNRRSLLVRELLENNGVELVNLIYDKIQFLNPKDQVDSLIALMPYVYPKLAAYQIEIKQEEDRPLKNVSDADLDAILVENKDDDHY